MIDCFVSINIVDPYHSPSSWREFFWTSSLPLKIVFPWFLFIVSTKCHATNREYSAKTCLGNLFVIFTYTFFRLRKIISNKFFLSRNYFNMKVVPSIIFKEIFTQWFYLHSFDIVMEFFHLESHSIDLVKENINFQYSFSFPFSFEIISFVMVEVWWLMMQLNNFFFFFFFYEIDEQ